jgi:hypothetical protein
MCDDAAWAIISQAKAGITKRGSAFNDRKAVPESSESKEVSTARDHRQTDTHQRRSC